MNYIEYGKDNQDVFILLHGGGLSWWNYKAVAEQLCCDFHVILPILNGHAHSDIDFTTIEDNAAQIIAFIDNHFAGSVLLIGGVSLGGQVLTEILSMRKDICQYAVVESTLVIPSRILHSLIKPAFGSCYGLIHKKWFSMLQFKSMRIKKTLFDDYFIDTCALTKANMIAFLQANAIYTLKESIRNCNAKVYIFVGEKERSVMKRSAEIIHEALRGSSLHVLPKLYHGEFSINHPESYAHKLLEITKPSCP